MGYQVRIAVSHLARAKVLDRGRPEARRCHKLVAWSRGEQQPTRLSPVEGVDRRKYGEHLCEKPEEECER